MCDPSEVLHKSVLFSYLSRHMSYSYTAIMCEYVSHIYLGLRSDHTGGGGGKPNSEMKNRHSGSTLLAMVHYICPSLPNYRFQNVFYSVARA